MSPWVWPALAWLALAGACSSPGPAEALTYTSLETPAAPRAIAGPAIVLLWRSDCAPCVAELAGLKEIERAAGTVPVVVAALEEAGSARAFLQRRGWSPTRSWRVVQDPRQVLTRIGGPPPRLPLAFAVDGDGRLCRRHSGLLGTDRVRQWVRQCS